MIKVIFTSIILYASTAVDLVVILMLLFSKYPGSKNRRSIFIGQFIGSYILILISLFFALILNYVPQKWLLGLLGLIPIGFGIRYLLDNDDEAAEASIKIEQRQSKSLIGTVILLTVASCGSDNLGLFIPYFVSLTPAQIGVTLIIFTIGIFLLVLLGDKCARIKLIRKTLDKFGNIIMAVVYIGLGLMIILESETIQHLIALINSINLIF